jgi:hypothetical protein
MTAPVPFGPYSSTAPYTPDKPSWVPASHKDRIAAYGLYREIYWSHVATGYKLMNRGLDTEDTPVYVPSSRIVVDTLNRYVGRGLTFAVQPGTGTEATILEATLQFTNLFARERFASRYAANKRGGTTVGDWGWHLVADPNKPEGQRISILPVKADNYFPVFEDEMVEGGDPDKLVMVLLAEQVQVGDETQVRVQRYQKEEGGAVLSSLEMWKPDEWFLWRYDDDTKSPLDILEPPTPLPPQVTSIPVYHIPNKPEVGEVFGTSPMRGLEVIQAALNQSATDEDLALALTGLGVYATDEAGSPINAQGEKVPWFIYPGAVVENAKGLRMVDGLKSLEPYNQHFNRLEGYMADATAATDAARGRIEVAEAESGIALQLRLAPTLAYAEEADTIILDVHRQMFYDLVQMWFPAFEGKNFTDVAVVPILGDKLPVNRAAEVAMVNELVLGGILSAASARQYLVRRGFTDMFDPREGDLVLAEKVANAAADQGDAALDDRAAQEKAGDNPPDGGLDDEEQE